MWPEDILIGGSERFCRGHLQDGNVSKFFLS